MSMVGILTPRRAPYAPVEARTAETGGDARAGLEVPLWIAPGRLARSGARQARRAWERRARKGGDRGRF